MTNKILSLALATLSAMNPALAAPVASEGEVYDYMVSLGISKEALRRANLKKASPAPPLAKWDSSTPVKPQQKEKPRSEERPVEKIVSKNPGVPEHLRRFGFKSSRVEIEGLGAEGDTASEAATASGKGEAGDPGFNPIYDNTPRAGAEPEPPSAVPSIAKRLEGEKETGKTEKPLVDVMSQQGGDPVPPQEQNQIRVSNEGEAIRGFDVENNASATPVISMAPGSRRMGGGDVVVFAISPVYGVVLDMPDEVEEFQATGPLVVKKMETDARRLVLKLPNVHNPTPMSLHVMDVRRDIYTFKVYGVEANLKIEFPLNIIITRKTPRKVAIGKRNPKSILNAMDTTDAVDEAVGMVPRTNEYKIKKIYQNYRPYDGYMLYAFTVERADKGRIKPEELSFTFWADGVKISGGDRYQAQRDIAWTVRRGLSVAETRRNGYDTLKVYLQIRDSLLNIESWTSNFITVADPKSYTRYDFPAYRRETRPYKGGNSDVEYISPYYSR